MRESIRASLVLDPANVIRSLCVSAEAATGEIISIAGEKGATAPVRTMTSWDCSLIILGSRVSR